MPLPLFAGYEPGHFVQPFDGFHSSPKVFKDKHLFPNETIVWAIQSLMHLFRRFPFKLHYFPMLHPYGISWSAGSQRLFLDRAVFLHLRQGTDP